MRKLFLIAIATMLVLPNCAKYRNLQPIVQPEQKHFVEQNNIQVATKKLSGNDCKDYFGNKRLVKKYDVIQLCIKNKRISPITLRAENISVPIERQKTVYKWLSLNTTGRVFARIIVGTALAGTACVSLLGAALFSMFGPITSTSYCLLGVTTICAAGAVGTVLYTPIAATKNKKRNINTKNYIHSIVFGRNEKLTIAPSETANKVIFVTKKQSVENFDVTFISDGMAPVAKFACHV